MYTSISVLIMGYAEDLCTSLLVVVVLTLEHPNARLSLLDKHTIYAIRRVHGSPRPLGARRVVCSAIKQIGVATRIKGLMSGKLLG